jgi:hypothetical protein
MDKTTDFIDEIDGIDLSDAQRAVKDHGRQGFEFAKEGYDKAREAVLDVVRPLGWKTVLGIVGGVVMIAGIVIMARRRRHRGNLLERGLHEGARYALLVPQGWHKAQKHALHVAHDSARESARLWKKMPRVRVEL